MLSDWNFKMKKLSRKIFTASITQFLILLCSSAALHAQDIDKIFTKGEEAFASGKYQEAEKSFRQVLEKDSGNYKVLRAQALVWGLGVEYMFREMDTSLLTQRRGSSSLTLLARSTPCSNQGTA